MNGRWAADEPNEDTWRTAQLVLVRHGESWWNAEGRVQGQGGTGLSDRGHTQAADVADHLLATYPQPASVFSSDLERVTQTAQPYLDRAGRVAELDKRLREIDSGEWTGLLTSEVAVRFPEQIAAVRRGEDIPRGSGENFAAMRARVAEALRDIARRTVDGAEPAGQATAIVFTHGGPIRVATAEALQLPPGGHRLLDPPDNCSVTVLAVPVGQTGEVGQFRLSGYNADHLTRTEATKNSQDAVGEPHR
ncbi:histidine phosphatase family protein [Phytoactinopolyspora alkaliphila]|uniref:Histidine phosphatase family protein n=1 Tax=Phytoactinopolyspora alkaliphila TaxID=1783498 RepID=A0A6N9YTF4_9ACTN|nr:histidine phosphatase family protein [Phytoactinopolyspora alkaliphila]